jgi:hypothetical protein
VLKINHDEFWRSSILFLPRKFKTKKMKNFLEKLSAEGCPDLEVRNTINLTSIFGENNLFDNRNLYFSRFGRIPNEIVIRGIDCKKFREWFLQTYRNEITDCNYYKRIGWNKAYKEDNYCFLFDDMLINFSDSCNYNWVDVFVLFKKTDNDLVDKMVTGIRKLKKRVRNKPEIELLVRGSDGFETHTMKVTSPKLFIEDNYNDDFAVVHQTILQRLQKKNDKGLVLLHGKPGTGKTSYIRYLITKTKKRVIFLPPNMAASITDPGLMNVLINNPDSIFVIEDAENIIIDRNSSGSSSVSALLNLADGILSDCLNIQLICSFNTDLSRVDSALTRKGRLIAKYEFLELSAPKAQALSLKLGFSTAITAPMALAAIYNQNDREFSPLTQKRAIGFRAAGFL